MFYRNLFFKALLFVLMAIPYVSTAQAPFSINNKGEVTSKNFKDLITKNQYQVVSAFDTVSKKPLLIYALYIKNNKFGILDINGREITGAVYDRIDGLDRGISANIWSFNSKYIVQVNKKYGLISNTGKQLIPLNYDNLYYEHKDSVFATYQGNNKVYVDAGGKPVNYIDPSQRRGKYIPEYDKTLNSAGTAYTIKFNYRKLEFTLPNLGDISSIYHQWVIFFDKSTKKYGVYSYKTKKLILPVTYDKIDPTGSTIFILHNGNKYGAADSLGHELYPVEAEAISCFSGATLIYKEGKYAVYNAKFQKLSDFIYSRYSFVSPNAIGLQKDGKYGMLSSDGKVVFDFKYDQIAMYDNHNMKFPIAITTLNNKMTVTDLRGRKLTRENYDFIMPECLAASEKNSLYEEMLFDSNQPNLYYFFRQNGKYGLLNNDFSVLLNNDYDMITKSTIRNLVYAEKDQQWGVVNIYTGKAIVPLEYKMRPDFRSRSYFMVYKDRKFGLFTENGKLMVPIEQTSQINMDDVYKGLIRMNITRDRKLYVDYLGNKAEVTE